MASLTGISSGSVTMEDGGTLRVDQQLLHPLSVTAEGPGRNGVEQGGRHAQQLHGVARGGRVEHHEVPAEAAPLLDPHLVEDLAQHHELGERWDGTQEVAGDAVLEDGVVEAPEPERHDAVLAHCLAGLHVDRGEVGAHLADLGARRERAQHGRHALLRIHLAHEHALTAARGEERQGGRNGRLADPAFARDDEQAAVEEGGPWHGA